MCAAYAAGQEESVHSLINHLGFAGSAGLLGLLALWRPVPQDYPGGAWRRLGIAGWAGLLGLIIPACGAFGAFGALSLWRHPDRRIGALAWCGLLGIFGLYGLIP